MDYYSFVQNNVNHIEECEKQFEIFVFNYFLCFEQYVMYFSQCT